MKPEMKIIAWGYYKIMNLYSLKLKTKKLYLIININQQLNRNKDSLVKTKKIHIQKILL